jgi:hypothetical protein
MGHQQSDSMPYVDANLSSFKQSSKSLDGIAREYLDSKPSAISDSTGRANAPAGDTTESSQKLSPEQLGFFHPVNLDDEHEISPLPPARYPQLVASDKPYHVLREVLPDEPLSIADMVTTDESGAQIPSSALQFHLNPSGAKGGSSKRKRDE